jgi:hypothetical protein
MRSDKAGTRNGDTRKSIREYPSSAFTYYASWFAPELTSKITDISDRW